MPTITLNSRTYETSDRVYQPSLQKSQSVDISLTKKTLSQSFDFTDQTFKVKILVPLTATPPEGDIDDLQTAYAQDYVSFTDQLGSTHDVFFIGPLPIPYNYTLIDPNAFIEIQLTLQKRQVS